ncbi:MAG TPA: beta-eliminating lyase-related protein [Dehalococcoidia bacterium]|nr:beta-eliminating lyase-related protein [Dehalococcoidia bacterium]
MRRVVNAAGHLSALGGSVLSPAVRAAMDDAATRYVDVRALAAEAEAEIARLCGAESAYVTAGAAAGIAIAVAGCVTRGDAALARQVPSVDTPWREVVVQAGHLIDFGATVEQMVALGGGVVRPVGTREAVTPRDLEAALGERSACLLWVQSHHTRENTSLPLQTCLEAARRRAVPFVMDCAAEEDLQAYTALGADLVLYSGTKAIGAPVSGIIAGREPFVSWCRAQSRGIARAMKVGKEQIAGLMAALREYAARDPQAEAKRQERLLAALGDGLRDLPGIDLLLVEDEAGRPIRRLALRTSPESARALAQALAAGDPAVYTRPHRLEEGLVQFDPRCLSEADVAAVVAAVRQAWSGGGPA